nr:LlaJI family restriction endonuclease [uncultured Adlercreutzia sp.]
MKRVFVRELKPYSVADIARLMEANRDRARSAIERLLAGGIICYRSGHPSGSPDFPEENATSADELYQFNWVGLAMVEDWIFVCYPKYLQNDSLTEKEIERHMILVLQVLRHQQKTDRMERMAVGDLRSSNKLPAMLRLLELLDEHGEYSNYERTYEVNGTGNIDWNRTINEHLPTIFHKRPIYTDLKTRRTHRDNSDYITRLHRAILTECSQLLAECGIVEMLGLSEIWLSDERVEDLGDDESLRWRIERERSTQFITWKQDVLDAMMLYLFDRKTNIEHETVQSLGTSTFCHLWEAACKIAFGDLLPKRLRQLPLPLADSWREKSEQSLLGIIPRPIWERVHDDGYAFCGDVATLIPDTIAFFGDGDAMKFCIYDAKYYVPSDVGKMVGQPGVEPVLKQFSYQSAYRDFILDHKFASVVNAFLVPGNIDAPRKMAHVSFPGVLIGESAPFSNYVDMWILPAKDIYEAYLRGETLKPSILAMIGSTT